MQCVMSCAFNINGKKVGYVIPQRGIKQGNPLSPYLFLLCAEGFSNLIQWAVNSRKVSSVKISRSGPLVSHLFFAGDFLTFCKATTQEARELKRMLVKYEAASGQQINDKSFVLFRKNLPPDMKQLIYRELGNVQAVT